MCQAVCDIEAEFGDHQTEDDLQGERRLDRPGSPTQDERAFRGGRRKHG